MNKLVYWGCVLAVFLLTSGCGLPHAETGAAPHPGSPSAQEASSMLGVGQETRTDSTEQKRTPTDSSEGSSTPPQVPSETFFLDSYEAANDGAAGPVFSSLTLEPGRLYRVTVHGTYTVWTTHQWTPPNGSPEPDPIYPSPGRLNSYVSMDAAVSFAAPSYYQPGLPFPRTNQSFQLSLDGGATWSHVTPTTSSFENHEYTYMVTGQGGSLGARIWDHPTSDNYGMLKVTVERPDEDGDGVPDDEDSCSNTAASDSAAGVPSMKLGVNRWADLNGDGVFDTLHPQGEGPRLSFALRDTAGCNCAQIIERLALGQGHTKYGCSISAMQEWAAMLAVNP